MPADVDSVPYGIATPNILPLTITPTDPTLDLRTVTAVSWDVLRFDGTKTVWSAAVTAATASELTCQHAFASGDWPTPSAPVLGTYTITAWLTVPSGLVPCKPRYLLVTDEFGNID